VRVAEAGGTLASRLLAGLLTEQGATVTSLPLPVPIPAPAVQNEDATPGSGPARPAPAGRVAGDAELAGRLRAADVLVDASHGALDAAGFGFARLAELRPGLIVCHIPSFPAPPGPAATVPTAGPTRRATPPGEPDGEWAVAAALGLDRLAGDEPAAEPLPMASAYAAILSGIYITAALLRRDAVPMPAAADPVLMEVSLFGAGMMVLDRRLVSVADPACADPLGRWRLPIAERYECADGRYLQCQGATPGVAAAVLAAIGHPEWTAEALTGITALPSAEEEARWRARFAAVFRRRPAAEWEDLIARHGGAGAVCRTREEWKAEPHAAACEIVLPGAPGRPGASRPGPAVRVSPAGPGRTGAAATGTGSTGTAPGGTAAGRRDVAASAVLPLAGTRVVDLSIILAGPTCGRLLAELGADVVKIDAPGRAVPPYVSPYGWLDVNRSKRSMLLDLSQPGARDVLWRLIEDADVLLENFRAGKLAALGFGTDAVFARNPRIVYTSLNAYDFGGGFTTRAGWEQNAQAISGMQVSRGQDGLPRQVPVPVNDYGTGLLGAFGTIAALRAARRTGRGQRVRGSLARTASFLQRPELHWDGQDSAGPAAAHRPGQVQFIRCADGWIAALPGPGRPGLAGSAAGSAAGQPCGSVLRALRADGVSCMRAVTVDDLRPAAWIREHGYLKTWRHPVWGEMTNVFARGRSSGFEQRDGWPAPDPGADGERILAGLGYRADEIAAMRRSGALGAPAPLFPAAAPAHSRDAR
jgi:crotonobetainyl-CoA:carnitine CoA-transferase CaiB-like acyl-CoA transferase